MINYWWIPCATIYYTLVAVLSVYAKESWKWVIILQLMGLVSLWGIVARYSKNLVADGMIFDLLILSTFYGTMLVMGQSKGYTIPQWIGFGLCLVGILLIKEIV